MAIIPWGPPWRLSSWFDEDWEWPTLSAFTSRASQGLNIFETEDELVAEAAVPGIPEDKVDVSVENGIVRISASAEEKQEEKGKRRYFMAAMASSYNYSFRLPEGVVKDKEPKAELDNGVLRLRFAKVKKAVPKKVKVIVKSKTK